MLLTDKNIHQITGIFSFWFGPIAGIYFTVF